MAKRKSSKSDETTHKLEVNIRDGRVHIFTDGSCSSRDRSGGWGALLIQGEREARISGAKLGTTIGEMEMTGILRGLERLKHFNADVVVYSDSQYCINAITTWYKAWRRKGWTTGTGKVVKNIDLIESILDISEGRNIAFRWVKGHAGIWGNEEADKLAGSARRTCLSQAEKDSEELDRMTNASVKGWAKTNEHWLRMASAITFNVTNADRADNGWASLSSRQCWSIYMIASYLYYEKDVSMLPDSEYDYLCAYLLQLGKDKLIEDMAWWAEKYYDEDWLRAGSGAHMSGHHTMQVINLGDCIDHQTRGRPIPISTDPTKYLISMGYKPEGKTNVVRKRVRKAPTTGTDTAKPVRVRSRTRVVKDVPDTTTKTRTRTRVRR